MSAYRGNGLLRQSGTLRGLKRVSRSREMQHKVKVEVVKAKQSAYDDLYARFDRKEGETDLYRLARQRDRDGKDVQQVKVIKDRDGNVLTGTRSVMERFNSIQFIYIAPNYHKCHLRALQ